MNQDQIPQALHHPASVDRMTWPLGDRNGIHPSKGSLIKAPQVQTVLRKTGSSQLPPLAQLFFQDISSHLFTSEVASSHVGCAIPGRRPSSPVLDAQPPPSSVTRLPPGLPRPNFSARFVFTVPSRATCKNLFRFTSPCETIAFKCVHHQPGQQFHGSNGKRWKPKVLLPDKCNFTTPCFPVFAPFVLHWKELSTFRLHLWLVKWMCYDTYPDLHPSFGIHTSLPISCGNQTWTMFWPQPTASVWKQSASFDKGPWAMGFNVFPLHFVCPWLLLTRLASCCRTCALGKIGQGNGWIEPIRDPIP